MRYCNLYIMKTIKRGVHPENENMHLLLYINHHCEKSRNQIGKHFQLQFYVFSLFYLIKTEQIFLSSDILCQLDISQYMIF